MNLESRTTQHGIEVLGGDRPGILAFDTPAEAGRVANALEDLGHRVRRGYTRATVTTYGDWELPPTKADLAELDAVRRA